MFVSVSVRVEETEIRVCKCTGAGLGDINILEDMSGQESQLELN